MLMYMPYSQGARGCLCVSMLLLERKWLSCMLGKQQSGLGWGGMGEAEEERVSERERALAREGEKEVCACGSSLANQLLHSRF